MDFGSENNNLFDKISNETSTLVEGNNKQLNNFDLNNYFMDFNQNQNFNKQQEEDDQCQEFSSWNNQSCQPPFGVLNFKAQKKNKIQMKREKAKTRQLLKNDEAVNQVYQQIQNQFEGNVPNVSKKEMKQQEQKLKNRIAAQQSRDKKKVYLTNIEQEVEQLRQSNQNMSNQINHWKSKYEKSSYKKKKLKNQLNLLQNKQQESIYPSQLPQDKVKIRSIALLTIICICGFFSFKSIYSNYNKKELKLEEAAQQQNDLQSQKMIDLLQEQVNKFQIYECDQQFQQHQIKSPEIQENKIEDQDTNNQMLQETQSTEQTDQLQKPKVILKTRKRINKTKSSITKTKSNQSNKNDRMKTRQKKYHLVESYIQQ